MSTRPTWWPTLWTYSHRLAARKFAPLAPDTAEPEDRCFPLNSEILKGSGRSWAEDCSKLGQPKEVLLYTYYVLHIYCTCSACVQVCHPFQASCEWCVGLLAPNLIMRQFDWCGIHSFMLQSCHCMFNITNTFSLSPGPLSLNVHAGSFIMLQKHAAISSFGEVNYMGVN